MKRMGDRIIIESIDELCEKKIVRIFEFLDGKWMKRSYPSKKYLKKISGYLDIEDLKKYERIFGRK